MSGNNRKKSADGSRPGKKRQASRQDVAARRAGDEAARPKTKHGAPKAAKPGHQPANPGRGEQARVGRNAFKPTGTEVREGRQDSLSGPSEKVRRTASMRTGGTGGRA